MKKMHLALAFYYSVPHNQDWFACFPDEITASFRRFGHLFVDWPHKAESKSYFPPKGETNWLDIVFLPAQWLFSIIICLFNNVRLCQPFPGYAFLLFQDESSVQALIDACIQEDGKLYLCVSSPTIKDKPVSFVLFLSSACKLSILVSSSTNVHWLTQKISVMASLILENWKVQYCCVCFISQVEDYCNKMLDVAGLKLKLASQYFCLSD